MTKACLWVGCLGAAWLVSGCGGNSDGAGVSCGDASPCGGDIVGNWKITSSCLNLDASGVGASMRCAGATSEAKDFGFSGTVAYNADKTYETNITVTGSVVVTLPASCLTVQNVTLTCGQLQQSFEATADKSEYESISCSGSSTCSCTLKLRPQLQSESGTYSTSGNKVTQTEAGGAPTDSAYCVKGTTLVISPQDPDSTVTGSVVLAKQ